MACGRNSSLATQCLSPAMRTPLRMRPDHRRILRRRSAALQLTSTGAKAAIACQMQIRADPKVIVRHMPDFHRSRGPPFCLRVNTCLNTPRRGNHAWCNAHRVVCYAKQLSPWCQRGAAQGPLARLGCLGSPELTGAHRRAGACSAVRTCQDHAPQWRHPLFEGLGECCTVHAIHDSTGLRKLLRCRRRLL